ncbi:hypothetical protein MPC4_400004 [Methylocella tundrae]|uniref:Uncharacterized protein n=1 Tax=Methylocella tundrae TaxID=227605 RepID=A0A8B6M9A6_METTU|nr:hypothetical protein MPC1_110006 [Methylocella tundrae]VTZ51603.1 hypothetical protein MPC4_400004 [Methylocella tundrae]
MGQCTETLLFGFPTPQDLPYAYILGVSLLRADLLKLVRRGQKPLRCANGVAPYCYSTGA